MKSAFPSSAPSFFPFFPRARRQGGFSLLEVVVAFAILALSLGLLLQIFSRALTATSLSGDYSRAVALAEARLNAVGVDIPLAPGSYSGDPETGLSWQVFIEPFAPKNTPWELPLEAFLVTAVASWGDDTYEHRQISLSTLRLQDSSDFVGQAPPQPSVPPPSGRDAEIP